MGRPPLPVGTFGKIAFLKVDGGKVRARARFRDYDGRVRPVSRYGPTKAAAERTLREALRDRIAPADGAVSPDMRLSVVAEQWLAEVDGSELADGTKQTYGTALRLWVLPGAGNLRLRELGVPAVDRLLRAVKATHGHSAAKTARTVLSGILGLAARHGAIPTNPVRDAGPLKAPRKPRPRSLTAAEEADLMMWLDYSPRARALDLIDLTIFLRGTGLRIGEALAVRPKAVTEGTLEVNATVIRLKGKGLVIQERAKSDAGWRVIALPTHVVEMIDRRVKITYPENVHGVIFPTVLGNLRDPSNTSGDFREVLDWSGYRWVTSHTFRKTVATKLDDAGISARQVADQLGHANPSMTTDFYMGRNVVVSEAATILAA